LLIFPFLLCVVLNPSTVVDGPAVIITGLLIHVLPREVFMLSIAGRISLLVVLSLGLIACQTPFWMNQKKAPPPPAPTPVVQKPAPITKEQQVVKMLILNGEYTLSQNQLLTPKNDNAYDYFRAALKLDPNNQRAKGGLQGIVMRYVDMARQAAARGNYSQATAMLNNARIVDPNNLLIKEVSSGLTEQIKSAPPVAPYRGGANEFLLDTNLVGKDHPEILARIADITNKVKETNSLAMIVARTDMEGRWIYQKMREAVPGYRVRGDIKLGSPVRVILEPAAQ
jgi:tetratricopeptide (TPR) repeat protein